YIVNKYCSNGNLTSFLENHHEDLTWLERYRLCIEVAKGLEFLHKSGIYHRNLHGGNVLLDDKRTAMLCDFGLSRPSENQATEAAVTVGVASFLAPEQLPAQRPAYTAECDIYSLGLIFWHISSGRIPFARRLRESMLLRELMDGLREAIVPGTPWGFQDLIVNCWDVTPSRRLKI
ncbi:MAG: kinase-like domain-containing protein, partial [Benniella sp.]